MCLFVWVCSCVCMCVVICVYVCVRTRACLCLCVCFVHLNLFVSLQVIGWPDGLQPRRRSFLSFIFWLFCLRLSATTQAPVSTTGRCDWKTFSTLYFASQFFNTLPTHSRSSKKEKNFCEMNLKKHNNTFSQHASTVGCSSPHQCGHGLRPLICIILFGTVLYRLLNGLVASACSKNKNEATRRKIKHKRASVYKVRVEKCVRECKFVCLPMYFRWCTLVCVG